MPAGELGMSELSATVGGLHRTEELRLQPVRVMGVQIVVGLGQAGERKPELVSRLGQRVARWRLASDAEYAIRLLSRSPGRRRRRARPSLAP
jgi:hypothetical protein